MSERFGDFGHEAVNLVPEPQALAERRDVMPGEQEYVVAALAQGRDVNLDDGQTVVEIEAETRGLTFGFEVAVRRGDDAHVQGYVLESADAPERTLFQNAQKLRLQPQLQLAYLI